MYNCFLYYIYSSWWKRDILNIFYMWCGALKHSVFQPAYIWVFSKRLKEIIHIKCRCVVICKDSGLIIFISVNSRHNILFLFFLHGGGSILWAFFNTDVIFFIFPLFACGLSDFWGPCIVYWWTESPSDLVSMLILKLSHANAVYSSRASIIWSGTRPLPLVKEDSIAISILRT